MIDMKRPDITIAVKEKFKCFLERHFSSNEQDIVAAYNQGFIDGMTYEDKCRTNNVVMEDIKIPPSSGFDEVKEQLEEKTNNCGAI